MILVTQVETWLFMDRDRADAAEVPTILVEKDASGAKSFTTMRTLFQLKKWTGQHRFVPLLSCDEAAYRAYEVFHVDAKPAFAILESGRMLMKDNERDEAYDNALQDAGVTTDGEQIAFAADYLERELGAPVMLAIDEPVASHPRVPEDVFVPGNVMQTSERLFGWANRQQTERGDAQ
ncbi:hypothetical protein [Exiguobacterium aurantiacum]|uniref:Uncharacterized protein n=1 Tax=Exiguobacterium aurantiacum TaxID=33987 RepID=A0ABY5FK73_9BACL|nr:hypothetical protein [Exiguobacterium aurantiacum]UTT41946.1 hypothetical protein NMQ00_10275 [Exiguobacterium aurantiacum]